MASRAAAPRVIPVPFSIVAIIALMAGVLTACASSTSPGPSSAGPSAPPSPTPVGSADGADRIVLDRAPDNIGCDTIAVSYRSVTFSIDPTRAPQVRAVTDRGATLAVRWDSSFVGGPIDDPSVLDRSGDIVARDGEVLAIPEAAWPSLHGHFVCPSETALYVLDAAAPA